MEKYSPQSSRIMSFMEQKNRFSPINSTGSRLFGVCNCLFSSSCQLCTDFVFFFFSPIWKDDDALHIESFLGHPLSRVVVVNQQFFFVLFYRRWKILQFELQELLHLLNWCFQCFLCQWVSWPFCTLDGLCVAAQSVGILHFSVIVSRAARANGIFVSI